MIIVRLSRDNILKLLKVESWVFHIHLIIKQICPPPTKKNKIKKKRKEKNHDKLSIDITILHIAIDRTRLNIQTCLQLTGE